MRRAFGTRGHGPTVGFTAAAEELRVRAKFVDAAVEYRAPGEHTAETLWLPFQALGDFEGKKDEPVELAAAGKGHVTAQWRDGSVPQIVRHDVVEPHDADKFPTPPETFAENSLTLLEALNAAGETTEPDAVRYATNCIQLRGIGSIVASDGRQLLVQDGFQFPWREDLLIPHSKVFGSPELAGDGPVTIGKADDWVALSSGPWTIWLAVNTGGRFPDLAGHIPQLDVAIARCRFSSSDAGFLGETLPRLPCDDEFNLPVTLDLNGRVAIRARAADQPRPTELVLTGSECSGEPIRIHTNRTFLARALKLGFQEVSFYGAKVPVLCQDERRKYLWALLDPDSVIKPAEDAIRIVSSEADPETPVTKTKTRRRVSPVSEPITNSNGNAATNGNGQSSGHAKANGQAKAHGRSRNGAVRKPSQEAESLIRQAEALRTSLRDTLLKTNALLKGLKQHRRQSRALRNTIDSLRQLKGLGV
jgi:hypothetical protein